MGWMDHKPECIMFSNWRAYISWHKWLNRVAFMLHETTYFFQIGRKFNNYDVFFLNHCIYTSEGKVDEVMRK